MNLNKKELTLKQASIKNGLILGLFALVSTSLIAITHLITKDRIADEVEKAMARRLNQLIPANQYDNDVYNDCLIISTSEIKSSTQTRLYRLRNQNKNYAAFISAIAPDGYAGNIHLVIGLYENGAIAGVRVTEHQETPGLGDKIEIRKSNWIEQFKALSLTNLPGEKWAVSKDGGQFDGLTGATITPRAIIKTVHKTLVYFQDNKAQLFSAESNCGVKR